ncbi:protein SODIUM POTASSIUM ROOT defective [Sesamum angolense]|uniref:Protein SODIUM POTASSIUM ROOT defective n=1 Tax=Sesamum angolense TaxID=2727404 RepID=A0AAE2BXZ6_9LAMI|nr:protein SODIUM POTASSIUM ROOT defective [Sesamum angolense]
MAMKMKTAKKMKGLMCHSHASTAVCMSQDYRSVVVPDRTLVDHVRLINTTNYVRLGEQRRRSIHHSSSVGTRPFPVVVMRVSIHCQGCAGKVKKHLSKMEGVTSFSIDLESKRVTVMGHVSPSGVLESISKTTTEATNHCQRPRPDSIVLRFIMQQPVVLKGSLAIQETEESLRLPRLTDMSYFTYYFVRSQQLILMYGNITDFETSAC